MVHRVDHGTRTEEEQRLEESVREKVEHGGSTRRYPDGANHVTELRARRVSKDTLNIALLSGHQRRQYRRDDANPGDHLAGVWHQSEQKRDLDQQVHACRDHRRRVDERGNRRGAFHGIRQPDVQGHLRGFAHRAAEHHQRGHGQVREVIAEIPLRVIAIQDVLQARKIHRASEAPQHEDAHHEAKVTNPIRQKSLVRSVGGLRALVPVTDEQVTAHTDEFPEDKHHHEIVGQDNAEHREHEHRQAREVPRHPRVFLHVTQ